MFLQYRYIPTSKSRFNSSSSKSCIFFFFRNLLLCFFLNRMENSSFSGSKKKWVLMRVKNNIKNCFSKPLVRIENGCFCIFQKSLSNRCLKSYLPNWYVLFSSNGELMYSECLSSARH